MRKLSCAAGSLAAVVVAWLPSADAEEALTLERALALAREHNPELSVLRTEIDSAEAQLDGAERLIRDNPTLSGAIGPRFRSDGETTLEYGAALDQPFEIAGQRWARVDAAEAGVDSARAHVETRELALAAEVKIAFMRALAAEATLDIAREAEALAKSALEASVERQRLGDASRVEVNAARIELGRAIRERISLDQDRRNAHGVLALLIGVADPELRLIGELKPPVRTSTLAIDEALAIANQNRAELRSATADLESAEAEERLAFREAFPDIGIGVAYDNEEGDHIVQGTISFALPLFDRNQAERGVSVARVERAKRSRLAIERAVEQEVRLAVARHSAAMMAAETYAQEVLAAIRENLELATEAYRSGKLDFLELMIVRRETVAARRAHVEALETLSRAEAELDRALGRAP